MTLLLFLSFFVFLALGLPIAVGLGLASIITLVTQDVPLLIVVQRMFAGADSFPLIAVPFFILAGDILAKGKVSEKLVEIGRAHV